MSDYKMRTRMGLAFDFLEPEPTQIYLEDIAHALSNICRFCGQVDRFYSVAQHSVLVSKLVPAEDALWGLFHDASEAYASDLPRYLKRVPGLKVYREIEGRIMGAIAVALGLPGHEPGSVSTADKRIVVTEYEQLFTSRTKLIALPEESKVIAYDIVIVPWAPHEAKAAFLRRYHELTR